MTTSTVVFIFGVIFILFVVIVWTSVLSDESNEVNTKICRNCPRGWCDCLPGEKGCIYYKCDKGKDMESNDKSTN